MQTEEIKLVNPKDWVKNYGNELYGFAFSKLSKQEVAEDLVQDTFLSALNAMDSFKGKSSERTWLYTILKNKIADYYRKASTRYETAAAHNAVYFVRENELAEIKADRIAMGSQCNQLFQQHSLQLQKGDVLYLFTDGYADQKGGTDRKKFYYPPFKQFLSEISSQSMIEQKKALYYTMLEWMKSETQTDDMTVIGIRI